MREEGGEKEGEREEAETLLDLPATPTSALAIPEHTPTASAPHR